MMLPGPYSFRTMVRSQTMSEHTIGGLARAGGVGVETIRYYQRRGLLPTPRRGGGIRHYDDQDLRALDATEDRDRARALARERIGALDAKIAELEAARNALKRLAHDCASSTGPCPIIAAFDHG